MPPPLPLSRRSLGVILALVLAAIFPHAISAEDAAQAATYMVYKGDRAVLKVVDKPGVLTSTALPAPGAAPAGHPFLTASALAPEEEHRLRQILDASENTLDFLEKLRQARYSVKRVYTNGPKQ